MNAPTPTIREVHPRERAQGIALKLSPFVEFSMRTVDVIEAGIREDRCARTFLESIPADGGTVKALEWSPDDVCWTAASELGEWSVDYDEDDSVVDTPWVAWGPENIGHFTTVDEARAAAQADFERRVLSCLSTHTAAGAGPVGEAVAERLRTLLAEVYADYADETEDGAITQMDVPVDLVRQAASALEATARTVDEQGRVERLTCEVEAAVQPRSYPGGRTREEWEIVAQASAARAAHLPED